MVGAQTGAYNQSASYSIAAGNPTFGGNTPGERFQGRIRSFRVHKGVELYTQDFTPPLSLTACHSSADAGVDCFPLDFGTQAQSGSLVGRRLYFEVDVDMHVSASDYAHRCGVWVFHAG